MRRKSDIAREAFRKGDIKQALRIAKGFRLGLSAEDRDALIRAYECLVHPRFYEMLGRNIQDDIDRGVKTFEDRILKRAKQPGVA